MSTSSPASRPGDRDVVPVHHADRADFTEGREEPEAAFTAAGLAGRPDPSRVRRA
ncbi:hypothetical protein ACH5AO_35415 [Streptomyces sp. NPDC018964]|uniref:hypothetical protein n=1 Tax=unclassified Streptomyces TaxID=2593676 RepID=UPI0037AF8F22